jgi:hypothetical protein
MVLVAMMRGLVLPGRDELLTRKVPTGLPCLLHTQRLTIIYVYIQRAYSNECYLEQIDGRLFFEFAIVPVVVARIGRRRHAIGGRLHARELRRDVERWHMTAVVVVVAGVVARWLCVGRVCDERGAVWSIVVVVV